jgi:hypothetical protein
MDLISSATIRSNKLADGTTIPHSGKSSAPKTYVRLLTHTDHLVSIREESKRVAMGRCRLSEQLSSSGPLPR